MTASTFKWDDEPDPTELWKAVGLLSSDREAALALLRNLAARGSIMSMIYLGHNIAIQSPFSANRKEALAWYRKAAVSGVPFAIYSLCKALHVNGNFEEEIHLLQSEQLLDYGPALNQLACIYRDGEHVPRDPAKAEELYRRAHEVGHLTAMRNLGAFYTKGLGGLRKIPLGIYLLVAVLPAFFREYARDGFRSERLM
ncbi:MAG TPA: hypothetical protein VN668_05895 [Stellaceae bacterium]|nr:hypothetical protein [Stellaceae bacterium]